MKLLFFQATYLLLLILSSCKVSEENISGVYRLKEYPKTKLILNKNKTFEFNKNLPKPGIEVFPDSTDLNFRTTGNWHLNKKKLVLNSFPDKSLGRAYDLRIIRTDDTSMTSFSFWDFYDDPVPIRFIKFPDNKIKFRLSNSISFFAEDFTKTDKLEFHFFGYRPYIWPEMTNNNRVNNRYKIILNEQNRQGFFNNVTFIVKRKKLINADKKFSLRKKRINH